MQLSKLKEAAMMFDFRRTFKPTVEEQLEDLLNAEKMRREWAKNRFCFICAHRDDTLLGILPFQDEDGTCVIKGRFVGTHETCECFQEKPENPEIAAAAAKAKQELLDILRARGTSKTRTHFIEKYGFDPWEDKE